MDIIYKHPNGGSLWQAGYREIPHNLKIIGIDVVIYTASECPPLNHHTGAILKYFPNEDRVAEDEDDYKLLLQRANAAVPAIVEAVETGKHVLVTCNQGMNRSSLVTGLALKKLTELPGWTIIDLIKERREDTLSNGTFMEMILEDKTPNPFLD